MFVLLDTHALIWLDQNHPALGNEARRYADQSLQENCLAVSAISFWEVGMLAAKRRIDMALPADTWRRDLIRQGLLEIPVDGDIAITAARLDLQGDPADRIIAATALIKGAILLTADQPLLRWANPLERHDARR
jgi:PIN domain nuclease of toxin-antitoxin system